MDSADPSEAKGAVGDVVSASDSNGLAVAISEEMAPPGTSVVAYVAAADVPEAIVTAAANATLADSIVLFSDGSDAAALSNDLAGWDVTEVRLVGPPAAFPAGFIDGLNDDYSVNTARIGTRAFQWSEAAVTPTTRSTLYLADPAVANSVATAATFAPQTDASIMIMDGDTPTVALTAILNSSQVGSVILCGDIRVGAFIDGLTDQARQKIVGESPVTMTPRSQLGMNAMTPAVTAGASIDKFVMGADNDQRTIALASLLAGRTNRMYAAGDNPSLSWQTGVRYMRLLGPEVSQVTLAGISATASKRQALLAVADQVTRRRVSGFRVTNTRYDSSRNLTTVTVTRPPEAGPDGGFLAFDATGSLVANTSSASVVFGGRPRPVKIVAQDVNWHEVATLQYRPTEWSATDPTHVSASDSGDVIPLRFKTGGIPRMVSRAPAPAGTTAPTWEPIAITCRSDFVDHARTSGDFQYRVQTLPGTVNACPNGRTGPATTQIAQLSMPKGDSTNRAAETDYAEAVRTAIAAANDPARRPKQQQDPDLLLRYNTFIPMEAVWGGMPYAEEDQRFFLSKGDNRSFDPEGTYRTQLEAAAFFGPDHTANPTQRMGESVGYSCPARTSPLADCTERKRDKAPIEEIASQIETIDDELVGVQFAVSATNPLQPAPAINATLRLRSETDRHYVRGSHDRFPAHEIYGRVGGTWYPIFQDPPAEFLGPVCLTGIPTCVQNIEITP